MDWELLFGQALFRDVILPDILGNDVANISYWEGKQLARRFQIGNINDLSVFFKQASFGTLQLINQTATDWQFNLFGEQVSSRLAYKNTLKAPFMIEAGFLAQTVEQMIEVVTEAETPVAIPKKATDIVTLNIRLDPKNAVINPTDPDPMTIINHE